MEGLETPIWTKCFKGRVSPFAFHFRLEQDFSLYQLRFLESLFHSVVHSIIRLFISILRVLLVVLPLSSVVHLPQYRNRRDITTPSTKGGLENF